MKAEEKGRTMGDPLAEARYVNLATFRRDGTRVGTPVWAAEVGGVYYVFSAGDAGKVKRLRHTNRAEVAACDARGGLLGEWHSARAELIEGPGEVQVALDALRAKYGWQMRLTDALAKVTGRYVKRAYIRVSFSTDELGAC
ncbi:MAG: PPOX class F420-dependent oxidoreductase [Gammaproteobacteria bacterium]|nr:PPOX class F420-dependent oxidoreductase [Gammaproteobacteria bacterium]